MLCRCGGRVRVASACGIHKRWHLLLGGNSIGGPVWLQAKTRYTGKISPANDGNSLNILYINERWVFTLFYSFLKTLQGIWMGMLTGTSLQIAILLFIIVRMKWETQVQCTSVHTYSCAQDIFIKI